MTSEELQRVIEAATKEIASWPQWKRDACESILANEMTRATPRIPIEQIEVEVVSR